MNKEFSISADDPSRMTIGGASSPTPAGLYIHVPFCQAKCPYCDFYSLTDLRLIPAYIDALGVELNLTEFALPPADSIYLGGGTPSVLSPRQIAKLLDRVYACFSVTVDAEVTLEVNPGTATPASLAAYRKAGINRLNIGLQSISDQHLRFLGRIHTSDQGIATYDWAREAGYTNVGLDLIYGIPGQTRLGWEAEMAAIVDLRPDHLSCYALTMEPGTPLAKKVWSGWVPALAEGVAGELFSATVAFLNQHGYRQYEISNFAREAVGDARDRRSRHNRKYWTLAPYLGFGPAAHSFVDATRWWNHSALDRYLADLKAGRRPLAGSELLTRDQQIMEFVYLGLRQTDGIDTLEFAARFDADFIDCFKPTVALLADQGLIETSSKRIRLSHRGMRFLESVADQLLS